MAIASYDAIQAFHCTLVVFKNFYHKEGLFNTQFDVLINYH